MPERDPRRYVGRAGGRPRVVARALPMGPILALVIVAAMPGPGDSDLAWPHAAAGAAAQEPVEGEVRQIVTFTFLPGKSAEAIALFRDRAVPLYQNDAAMLSFRGFREVESPIPLSLMVVSAFRGMAGMDEHNAALAELAANAGSSVGEIYGAIGALSSGHTDQFVEMLPALGSGDVSSRRLTAFVWYRTLPGRGADFETALAATVVPWETAAGVRSATGRFLVADAWNYLRFLGLESLGAYQDYWAAVEENGGHGPIDEITAERREVIAAPVPELAVR